MIRTPVPEGRKNQPIPMVRVERHCTLTALLFATNQMPVPNRTLEKQHWVRHRGNAMKPRKLLLGIIFAALCSLTAVPFAHAADANPFLGRWDLTLKAPDGEYPSWLDVRQQGGELTARFTGRWVNARPLPKIEV